MKNKMTVISLIVIGIILFFAFLVPSFYPYGYEQQIRGAENLSPFEYSAMERERIASGERVFPHVLGTDRLGRDFAIRVMMGSRISLIVGLVAAVIIFAIGSTLGAISAFYGGWVDALIMRTVDVIYTVPDILFILLLSVALEAPLKKLSRVSGFGWMQKVGPNMISIFVVFALLYWAGMARMVRGQILVLKENEYVTASRALGASSGHIIRKHLLANCVGTLITTTTLQIPASIFTESFLSFLGLGVAAPMPSLGSLASNAISGFRSYPHMLFVPAILISIIILSFNLLGDGLRDALDPKQNRKGKEQK